MNDRPTFSIIIGCYNNRDLTKACIESVLKYTDMRFAEVIVIVNGCEDGTIEMLEDNFYNKIDWYNYINPLGYAKAYNEGIKKATGEYIVLLNNDTILQDQPLNLWLDTLKKPFIYDDKVGVTGPLSLSYNNKPFIVFFCAMIHSGVFDKIGLLDESFEHGGGEDVDFCWRAVEEGYKIKDTDPNKVLGADGRWICNFPIYHAGGKTVHEIPDWENIFNKNIEKVVKKHQDKFPTVHVIMPAYNCRHSITKSIEGVLNQTGANVVLHIVDDCSSDGTWEWLQENFPYMSPVKIYRTDKNGGAALARNVAMEQITQDALVALCDADDIWHPNHLSTSLAIMASNNVDLVYCDPKCVTASGEQVWPTFPIPKDGFDLEQLKWNNFIFPSTVLFKNTNYRFNPKANKLEDWELFIRMAKAGKRFVRKDPSTVVYLVNTGGANNGAGGDLVVPIIKALHPDFVLSNPPIKLNLGCGEDTYKGYVNIDLYDNHADIMMPAEKLELPDGFADEIVANHIIEHYPYCHIWDVLKEWCRVLKPGGRIEIETPDFIESCKGMVEGPEAKRLLLYGHFFATPWDIPGQVHRFLFTEHNLIWTMEQCGFKNVRRVPPKSSYTRYVEPDFLKYFLRVEGTR